MSHYVRDWMSAPVIVVDPDTSVSHAMTLMRRRNIHSVVVDIGQKNPVYGIVTTTDIRDKIAAAGRNPANTRVREIMSGPLITGRADWTLMECSRVMQVNHVHHLPVADEHGTLVGLISATDIFVAVEEAGWTGGLEELEEEPARQAANNHKG
ncbi:MAG TPA: CBS domain-containing protein [Anaerolineales bacterium]|nr:CBS domain-containing protein [Anaerolineales bacterium]